MSTILNRLERARSGKGITVVSIIGLILVPLVIAGGLVWALWNPAERLGQVTAAIVNDDKPVTVNGQTVPLGRQLSAGLVDGDQKTNYTWVITDASDAKAGLADGSYTAVVTIPENFSKAATSFSGDAANAERARLDVTTSDRSKLVDDAISQTITQTAASLLGRQLTTTYLENVYVGFNTLHDQLGEAADGAKQLSTGGLSLAQGAQQLANGTTQLATGATQLSSGATQLSDGVDALADGATQLSSGATQLSGGASQLAGGAATLNAGAQGDGTTENPGLVGGAAGIAGGANDVSAGLADLSAGAQGTKQLTAAVAAQLASLTAECAASGASATYCADVAAASGLATTVASGGPVGAATDYPGTASLADSTAEAAGGAAGLAAGATQFSSKMPALVEGIAQLNAAAAQIAAGASGLADGASQAASGTAQLQTGASALADGAGQAATGTTQLADASNQLASGAGTLSGGITSLASGLQSAVDSLPTYTSSDRQTLADVVADPVSAGDSATVSFGTNSAPFYAVLALWLGALASFLVLRPVPTRAFGSTRSSLRLALGAFVPAGAIGMLQGLLVAVITAPLLDLDAGGWLAFAGIAVLAGLVFAAANQALNALFGGAGRFVSMIVALVGLATGIIATAPEVLDQILAFLPIAPALGGLQAIAIGDTGAAAGVVGLVLWLLGSLAATTFAIARARITSVKALVPAVA
ncbi:YhgE/Pip domain-containing protein [Plantibacter sp. CFBP 8804]|uniref:YhgE/Pip domain-containing protein n=1 Tax=Plantibacter sp. CFBP 8804 TaxID=2775270 RepID=UPI0017810D53|nr:YhgE/Pip domain-containing protein [Plantibacter sp. CFBP 8804]MBD8517189.1 YhgE/Pip domain-containing protein [Plantibacter sp. CFBP 8804]